MGIYKPPTADGTHYVTLQEAARLGYGAYSTLRNWIRQGRLPAVKTGNRVKILRADLDALTQTRSSQRPDIDRAIAQIVDAAPALSPGQVERLRGLLGSAAA